MVQLVVLCRVAIYKIGQQPFKKTKQKKIQHDLTHYSTNSNPTSNKSTDCIFILKKIIKT